MQESGEVTTTTEDETTPEEENPETPDPEPETNPEEPPEEPENQVFGTITALDEDHCTNCLYDNVILSHTAAEEYLN